MFAHAQTVFLLVGGLVITAVCGLLIELSMIGVLPITGAVAAIVVVAMLIAAGDVILNAVYGQSGSRVFRMQRSAALLVDDDAYWKLGLFYYNPGDASLFLPQRSGFGWTVNWARPAVWAVMAGFVVATALFVVLCVAMVD